MQFVLHKGVESLGGFALLVVVIAALLKHIGNLLIGTTLAGANLADALQQLVEIVLAKRFSIFEHIIVQHKTLGNVLLQSLGRPYTESRGLTGVDAIADGDDSIEVVERGKIIFAVKQLPRFSR